MRVHKDGSDILVLLNVWPLFGATGEVIGVSTVTHDVTAEARAVRAREDAETRFQAAFRRSAFGMVILDGTPTAVNPAICELLGRSSDELTSCRWGYYSHPDDAHLVTAMLTRRAGATGRDRAARDSCPLPADVNLSTGAVVVGLEALARWTQPTAAWSAPTTSSPLAEASGLIVSVGEAMLSQAVREVATWNAEAPNSSPLFVSVNLSARQLADPHLVELVTRALRGNDLAAELLHLEVTETAVIENITQSCAVLQELKAFGVRLSIDDFGTGYSSLAYLSQLPVNTIKIDRAFVNSLGPDDDTSIISAIVHLSQALSLDCVAEGVETADQRAFLLEAGCEFAQGYLWSPPLSPGEAYAWLGSHR